VHQAGRLAQARPAVQLDELGEERLEPQRRREVGPEVRLLAGVVDERVRRTGGDRERLACRDHVAGAAKPHGDGAAEDLEALLLVEMEMKWACAAAGRDPRLADQHVRVV